VPDISLPWGAWYHEALHTVRLPDDWRVDTLSPCGSTACSERDVARAIENPIDSPPLCELARDRKTACIVVDDLARPTRADELLPPVLDQLHAAGLAEEAVRIVVATGTHAPLGPTQLDCKLGADIVSRYRVESHDCAQPLAATGILYGKRELRVNRTFFESDLKIALGSVLPHSFAGYSGGAKLVLPGLADAEATSRSHKFVLLGLRGGSGLEGNRFRSEAEQLARRLGLSFVVCAVPGAERKTLGVFAGDVVAAHRRACAEAETVFRTELSSDYDCLILNAYPKDIDLIQSENVFVALKRAKTPVVASDGVIVLTSAASEGVGRHGLFEPGGLSYRAPVKKRALGGRELWLYVPNVPTDDVRKLFWSGYPVFHDAHELEQALAKRLGKSARAAVVPMAPMQQLHDVREGDSKSD